jgi:hypothetical protein
MSPLSCFLLLVRLSIGLLVRSYYCCPFVKNKNKQASNVIAICYQQRRLNQVHIMSSSHRWKEMNSFSNHMAEDKLVSIFLPATEQ